MKLYVPSIGHQIRLTAPWTFPVYCEYRNSSLLERMRPGVQFKHNDSAMVTLETGTVLRVARIYIRAGKGAWDSITFTVADAPNEKQRQRKFDPLKVKADNEFSKEARLKGARFWAKLDDVNEIECERVVEDAVV